MADDARIAFRHNGFGSALGDPCEPHFQDLRLSCVIAHAPSVGSRDLAVKGRQSLLVFQGQWADDGFLTVLEHTFFGIPHAADPPFRLPGNPLPESGAEGFPGPLGLKAVPAGTSL